MRNIIITAILCVGIALAWPGNARGDDLDVFMSNAAKVCDQLDVDSSPAGIDRMLTIPMLQGIPHDEIVLTVSSALNNLCPEHWPAFRHAVAVSRGMLV